MEGSCSAGQSPQWAVVTTEEEEYSIGYSVTTVKMYWNFTN
jgi:hypothetical protein